MNGRLANSQRSSTPRRFLVTLGLAFVVLAVLPTMALAATRTWNDSGATHVWSLGMNWVGGVAPVNGDDLVFPAGAFVQATNDDSFLTEAGAVDVSGTITVDSTAPLVVYGPLNAHQSPTWNVDTYLAGDLAVSETPAATPAPMTIGGSFDMDRAEYVPSALSFDVASLGSIRHSGSISGPNTACSLTKTGAGDLRLGWGGADATPWSGSNTWGGPTAVQAGSLTLWNPGALASGSDLDIAEGATVSAHYAVAGHTSDTWDNEISGAGDLDVDAGALTLSGDSQDFTGTTTVGSGAQLVVGDVDWADIYGTTRLEGGVLRGVGGVDTLAVDDGGVVSPGHSDYDVGQLWANSSAVLAPGGSYAVDMSDAEAGPIYGWDFLQVGDLGSADVTATPAHPFTIKLRSVSSGASGDAANFANDQEYRWSIIYTGTGVTGFDSHAFTVDTSGFTNDFGDGQFSVEKSDDGTSIDLVYSPVQAPTITACSLPATAGAASWTNTSPTTWTVQAVDPQNDAMTLNYQIDGTGTVYTASLTGTPKTASGSSALEGSHWVDLWVTDIHGYPSDHVTGYFKLDATNPVLTFGSHQAYYSATGVTFTWSATDNLALTGDLRYQYKLVVPGQSEGDVAYSDESTDVTATYGSVSSPLTEGTYSFYCKVRDNAGNWDTESFSFVVDRTAPTISGLTTPAATTNASYVDLSWSGADNIDLASALTYSYRVTKDGSAYIAQTSLGNTASVRLGSSGSPLPAGSYVFYVKATDTAGNTCTELSRSFIVDRTAPTVDETTSYLTSSSSVWKSVNLASPNGPATLAGADSGGSGLASIMYRVKTGATWGNWTTYSSGITITSQATHDIEFYSLDNAGNESTHTTKYYNLDKTVPTLGESTSYLTTTQTWTSLDLAPPNGPATLTAADTLSGVASMWYRIRISGVWSNWLAYADGITITDEQAHLVEAYALDNAGNESVHLTKYYDLDKTNPVLSFGSHSAYYAAASVTFMWSATDNLSSTGNLRYRYKVVAPGQSEGDVAYSDESTDVTATYGSVSTPLTEGTYSFYCKVRDNAGNWDTKSFSFVVDRTAPSISGLTTPAATTNASSVALSWSGSDNIDLASALTYSYRVTKDGSSYIAPTSLGNTATVTLGSAGSPLPDGSYVFYVKATDTAGNTCSELTRSFVVDRTAPTVSEPTNYLSASSSAWNNVNLSGATLQATDALSGVACVKYRIKTGTSWSSWTIYSSAISLSDEGTHDVEFYATDNVGNDSVNTTKYYNLDKTNPALTLGTHQIYYNTTGVTFTWSATDNLALTGDLRYQYKLVAPGQTESGVPYNAENTDITATYGSVSTPLTEGTYSFYCKVRDNAGNWDTKSFSFVVDRTAPSISGLTTPAAWNAVSYLDFGWSGSDNIDPPAALTYSYRVTKEGASYVSQTSLGNTATVRVGSSDTPLPDGNYVLYLKASDQSGNTCSEVSRSFGIDRTPPTVTVTRPTGGASYIQNSNVTCNWTTSDSLSGVAGQTATIDGIPVATGARLDTYSLGAHTFVLVALDAAGNSTGAITRVFNVSAPPSVLTMWSPNGGESYFQNSNDSIVWTAPTSYASGYFTVCVTSPTLKTFYVSTNVPATGASSYSLPWYVSQTPGTDWKAKAYYYDASGVKIASDASDSTFAIVSRTPTITTPNGGGSYIQGSSQMITWTMPAAGALGVFRLCLTSPTLGSFYIGGDIPATGATSYSLPWQVTQTASNDWKAKIYFYDQANVKIASDTSDAPFVITGRTPHVTMPNGGAVLPQSSTQTITWTIPSPVTTGYFKVCVSSATKGTTYLGGTIAATGALSYSLPWTVSQAVAADWLAKVYYYDAGDVKIGSDASDATFTITIAPPRITFPNGGGSYHQNSVQNVTWDMPSKISGGYFKVCATSPSKGTTYFGGNVAATGAASYTLPWTVTQAIASDWLIKVYYYDVNNVKLVSDASDASFSIIAP